MNITNERFMNVFLWLKENGKITSQKDLALKTGISENTISRIKRGKTEPDIDTLTKLNKAFDNMFRIMYFGGYSDDMFAPPSNPLDQPNLQNLSSSTQEGIASEPQIERPRQSRTNGKPYYNVDFALGFCELENDQTRHPDYLIDFAPYNNICDLWCNAYGDSMHPTISSGDIVALKRIQDFSYLINGQIYAIVTSNGLRTIKRIHDNGDTITLIADNETIPEQIIPKKYITHAYLVRGTIKMF